MSCCRIVGPIFFENTIIWECYIDIVHEFFRHLTWWGGLPKHGSNKMAQQTVQGDYAQLYIVLEWIISKGLQPPGLLHLLYKIFFYGATLKTTPIIIIHAIWVNWKPTNPTFHPWCCKQCLQTLLTMLGFVCNMPVHTSKTFVTRYNVNTLL